MTALPFGSTRAKQRGRWYSSLRVRLAVAIALLVALTGLGASWLALRLARQALVAEVTGIATRAATRAVQELVRLGDLEPLRVFAKASNELTVGEMRQLSALDALAFSEEDYEFLIRAKTAALFSAATEVGALCGATRVRDALARYGAYLGMAFQVVDDLLDYTEAAETVGKPTGLDLREHKVTLPLIAVLSRMSPAARRVVDQLFASPEPSDPQIAQVIEIVRDAGGLDYARRRGEEYADRAEESLASLPSTPARAALHDTLTYVMGRRS